MASGEAGEPTRGAQDHRADGDAALRPRGRAAGGPRGAQEAPRRDHVARGHATMQDHVGACVGAPRGRGVRSWRAHGYSGPW